MFKNKYNEILSTLSNIETELYLSHRDMGFKAALRNF